MVSDLLIAKGEEIREIIKLGAGEVIEKGVIVTLEIKSTYTETDYGQIEVKSDENILP